jgi:hypothetical protein
MSSWRKPDANVGPPGAPPPRAGGGRRWPMGVAESSSRHRRPSLTYRWPALTRHGRNRASSLIAASVIARWIPAAAERWRTHHRCARCAAWPVAMKPGNRGPARPVTGTHQDHSRRVIGYPIRVTSTDGLDTCRSASGYLRRPRVASGWSSAPVSMSWRPWTPARARSSAMADEVGSAMAGGRSGLIGHLIAGFPAADQGG